MVAALDYARLARGRGAAVDTLLFVAHRSEILRQSRQVFREVLREREFGELYVDGERPLVGRHVFASIQSLAGLLDRTPPPPEAFSMVIVDEVHHAAADTYRKLLGHVRPAILLGLTATPERTDDDLSAGLRIEDHFPRPWAAELRLWEAINRQILVPFNYFAIDDQTDLREVKWSRGRYDVRALSSLYDSRRGWVREVAGAIHRYVQDAREMRALAFCVDKAHARLAAAELTRALGVRCVPLTSDDPDPVRRDLLAGLASSDADRPRILCAVDLLNEGIDVPGVDTILLLRPTESATLFVQQIGRGLRRAPYKDCLTILDFVGVQREKFRFDLRYRALLGVRPGELQMALKHGFARLPAGCSIQLEERPREQVLAALKRSLRLTSAALASRLDRDSDSDLRLAGFLAREGLEVEDVYRDECSWTSLRHRAGLGPAASDPLEEDALRRLQRLIHVDDPWRLELLKRFSSGGRPRPDDERERRLAQVLLVGLYDFAIGSDVARALDLLATHDWLRTELTELVPLLRLRARVVPRPASARLPAEVPLHLHAHYVTDEIAAAFEIRSRPTGRLYRPQQGVIDRGPFDLLLVTLDKSGKSKLPHLQYDDRAISADLFHWQSQAKTTRDSHAGRRHLNRDVVPLLFVREEEKDDRGLAVPYRFLGPADRVEDRGERPMSIVFRLDTPMPADLLLRARAAVA